MKTLIIGCETIKEELISINEVQEYEHLDFEWVEGGLHAVPKKLKQEIQSVIDRNDGNYKYILLGYGYCGGGTDGLVTRKSTLVLPKVSDCISMLLGSEDARRDIVSEDCPFFITKGWARTMEQGGDVNIKRTIEKFGYEKTRYMYKMMFSGYRNIDIIDTGAYPLDDDHMRFKIDELNGMIDLPEKIIDGDMGMLVEFLSKKWNSSFLIKKPGEVISQSDFVLNKEMS